MKTDSQRDEQKNRQCVENRSSTAVLDHCQSKQMRILSCTGWAEQAGLDHCQPKKNAQSGLIRLDQPPPQPMCRQRTGPPTRKQPAVGWSNLQNTMQKKNRKENTESQTPISSPGHRLRDTFASLAANRFSGLWLHNILSSHHQCDA